MAQRTAQISIQVDNKSLLQLKQEIKELEKSMSNLTIGTSQWNKENEKLGQLKTTLQNATQTAKELQGQVQKISFEQQIKSVAKLGAGIVGAFTAVSGSIRMLGVDSEAFEEMTARATTLMSIMGGLNQLSETFAASTVKGLKDIGGKFTALVATVKSASAAMKVALISTGIGALVVVVGLLIANFEKLKNMFNGTTKEAKKLVEETKKESVLISEQVKTEKLLVEEQYKLNNGKSEEYNIASKNYELGKLVLKDLEAQVSAQEAIVAQLKLQLETTNTLFGIGEKKKKKAIQDEIDLANAELERLKVQKQIQESDNKRSEVNMQISEELEKQTEKVNELERNLQKSNAELFQSEKSYKIQLRSIDEQIKQIKIQAKLNGELTQKDKERIKDLKNQREILTIQNNIRKEQLETEIRLLEFEIGVNRELQKQNIVINEIYQKYNDERILQEGRLLMNEKFLELIESINLGLEQGNEIYNRIVNFDLNRNKILKERVDNLLPTELLMSKETLKIIEAYLSKYDTFTVFGKELKNAENVKEVMIELTDMMKENLLTQSKININYDNLSKTNRRILDNAASELAIRQLNLAIQTKSLIEESKYIDQQREKNEELRIIYTEINNKLVDQQKLQIENRDKLVEEANAIKDNLERREEYEDLLLRINSIENDIFSTQNDMLSTQNTINNLRDDEVNYLNQKQIIEAKIAKSTVQQETDLTEITAKVEDQLRITQKLKSFTEKYNEEIRASTDLIYQSFELLAVSQEQLAEAEQRNIDKALENQQKLLDAADEYKEKIKDLDELQKDANGERYDEIEARRKLLEEELDDKRKAWQGEEEARVKAVNAKNKAEENAAKWRKAQSIIDATIQTALAVIEALPNVILSSIVGALGAASIATIAAQKIPEAELETPEKVPFKTGGFTGFGDENEPAGIAHKGEYVVPARIVKSPSAKTYIEALEKQRIRGYQDGGFVTPASIPNYENIMDYEKFANVLITAVAELPNPQVALVSVSNGLRNVELTKQSAGLTR